MADVLRKHKRSKRTKKSWRKHTDVTDIEEHLEEERRDDRTGWSVSDKKDDVIFYIDAKVPEENNNLKSKRKLKSENKDVVEDDDDEEVYVSRKDRLMKRLATEEAKERHKKDENRKIQNIWGQEVMTVKDAFLEPAIKKPKVKPVTIGTGKSSLEAVSKPHPGSSYNPDYESHQDLLSDAHEKELQKLKEREKLNRKVKMIGVDELKKQSERWLKEMSEGLYNEKTKRNEDEVDGEEGCQEDEDQDKRKKKQVQKTVKQKKKARLLKKQERDKMEEKKKKKNVHDIYRVKQIKREIEKDARSSLDLQMKSRKESAKNDAVKTKRLGKHKFEDVSIAVQLSSDLSCSLRELKPEGSLLQDRFKSLQKRNIIEPRKPVMPRRTYKRKMYVRRSYKTKTIKDFQAKS